MRLRGGWSLNAPDYFAGRNNGYTRTMKWNLVRVISNMKIEEDDEFREESTKEPGAMPGRAKIGVQSVISRNRVALAVCFINVFSSL